MFQRRLNSSWDTPLGSILTRLGAAYTLIANAALLATVQAVKAELRHPTGPQEPAVVNKQEGDWDNNLHGAVHAMMSLRGNQHTHSLFHLRRPPSSHNEEKQGSGNTRVIVCPIIEQYQVRRHNIMEDIPSGVDRIQPFWKDEVHIRSFPSSARDDLQNDQEACAVSIQAQTNPL